MCGAAGATRHRRGIGALGSLVTSLRFTVDMSWHSIKQHISQMVGVTDDQLHTHLGLLLFVLAAILLRASPRRWYIALAAVVAIELLNKTVYALDWFNGITPANWPNSIWDIANTLFWAAVLTLVIGNIGNAPDPDARASIGDDRRQ